MLPLDTLISRLEARGCRPRRAGKGWSAFCPVHETGQNVHKPSLSAAEGNDGRALVRCHAGCATEAIVKALDLSMRDLFPSGNGTVAMHDAGNGKGKIEATYRYRDEAGQLLYEVVRFAPKDFRQRQPKEGGGWNWSVKDVRRVPYGLPELLAADPDKLVFVVEGEKDADRLTELGLVATTNAGGAGKWQPEFSQYLKGRRVAILPDNDEPGRKHAEQVAGNLHGVTASVRIVALDGLPDKGDVSDWLDKGGTIQALQDLAERAPEWKPSADEPSQVICLANIPREEVRWLWPGRIALGKLTLVQGDPDAGKSFLTLDMAARVSTGRPWPDDPNTAQQRGAVFLLSSEDDVADTIRPRLEAAGADLQRVYASSRVFSLTSDLSELERLVVERPGVRLVVIDPIGSYLANVDSHKNAEVRRVLDPLAALAGRHGIAVVCVIHLNKKTDSPAMYRASGSVGFSAAARAVWSVKRDPEDRDRRLLVCVKNNLAEHAPGLAYRIVAGSVPKVGRVEWEPGSLPVENDDPSPISPTSNEAKKEREDAKAWLQEVLTEETIQTKDLQRMARESGYSWATVRRAARDLKVESKRQGFGRGSTCYWVLPGQKWPPETTIDAQNTIGAHAGHVSIYGNSEHLCEERPAPEGPQVGNARLSNDPNAP